MKATVPILLVEDDEVDALSTKRAFGELGITNPLLIKKNGEEALAFLKDGSTPKPGLILLDLNMPKINGIEFLRTYKQIEELKWIPAVVLTTSANHRDIQEAYLNQCAGYMVKPLNFNEFKDVIKDIFEYWSRCELPDLH